MKTTFFSIFIVLIMAVKSFAGTLLGSWEMQPDGNSSERAVMIATENYFSISVFEKNVFIRTYGGIYEINDA